jgi:hypothetical protein
MSTDLELPISLARIYVGDFLSIREWPPFHIPANAAGTDRCGVPV